MQKFRIIKPAVQIDNGIGGTISQKPEEIEVQGFIDLLNGQDANNQNTFMTESTHVILLFGSGYEVSTLDQVEWMGDFYEITFVDNRMMLNRQLEIYLKKVA